MSATHTKTFESIRFADPYKVCFDCGGWVEGVLVRPGEANATIPCHHEHGYVDACPSWSPVSGCRCLEKLGAVSHDEPPRLAASTERPNE